MQRLPPRQVAPPEATARPFHNRLVLWPPYHLPPLLRNGGEGDSFLGRGTCGGGRSSLTPGWFLKPHWGSSDGAHCMRGDGALGESALPWRVRSTSLPLWAASAAPCIVFAVLAGRARGAFENPGGWNALPASELDGCLVERARVGRRPFRPSTFNPQPSTTNSAGGHERQHPRAATSVRQERAYAGWALRGGCERGTRGLRGRMKRELTLLRASAS